MSGSEGEVSHQEQEGNDNDDIQFVDEGEEITTENSEKMATDNPNTQSSDHTPSELRMLSDYRSFLNEDPESLCFSVEPFEGRIDRWKIFVHSFGDAQQLMADMKKWSAQTHKDRIELDIYFPPDYPDSPPFIHFVEPRFVAGGQIKPGGALCLSLTTMEGWNPVYDAVTFINGFISFFLSLKPKINFENTTPYSLQEAIASHKYVGSYHKWQIRWLPQ